MLPTVLLLAGWMAATDPVIRTVALSDMPPSEALKGAVLRVEKKNGSFNEGLVTSADSTRLVIDSTQDIPAADIAHVVTLRPARFPVAPGAFVRVVVRERGAVYRGVVTDVADDSIAVQNPAAEARVKWTAIDRIEVEADRTDGISLLREMARGGPTPTPTAEPVATPLPVPTWVTIMPEPTRPEIPVVSSVIAEPSETLPPAKRSFIDQGNVELGGGLSLFTRSSKLSSSRGSVSSSGHSIRVLPFAGIFLRRGFEVLGELSLSSDVRNYDTIGDEWENYFGGRVGAAYFFKSRSGVCFGPEFLAGFYSAGGEFIDPNGITYEYEQRGSTISGGLGIRVPMGNSALVKIGIDYYDIRYTEEIYPGQLVSNYWGYSRGIETSLAFSMWLDR